MDKKKFLEKSASNYHDKIISGWEKIYIMRLKYLYEKLKPFFKKGHALELGPADGIMTKELIKKFKTVTVVDGSKVFLNQIKKKIKAKNLFLVHSLFEEFESQKRFDAIFMTHILEHLDNPILVLKKTKKWLKYDGKIFIAVPNANSLHRLVGVKMGLLKTKDSLNKQDLLLGHRRVYTPEMLTSHVKRTGLKIEKFGGLMVKPLSNRQIEKQWSDELIKGYYKLGEDFPELCSEIYIIAKK